MKQVQVKARPSKRPADPADPPTTDASLAAKWGLS